MIEVCLEIADLANVGVRVLFTVTRSDAFENMIYGTVTAGIR